MMSNSERGKACKTQCRNTTSARVVRAAGLATTAVAGALAIVATAPQATADTANSLQPLIDQLLQVEQQAVANSAAEPFATPTSDAMMPAVIQNEAYELLLLLGISGAQASSGPSVYFTSPEVVAGDAADSRAYTGFFDPSKDYALMTGINPEATYELTGTVGKGTANLSIGAFSLSGSGASTSGSVELHNGMVVNPDGTYTITIGPTPPAEGNYIDDTGGGLIVRDELDNWALGPGNFNIECVADCPAANPGVTETGLSGQEIATLLGTLTHVIVPLNQVAMQSAATGGILAPANTMGDFTSEAEFPGGIASQAVSVGNFDLQPDEALIVKVPDVLNAPFSSMELENAFGVTLPWTLAQTSLNNTQSFHDPDGYTYYVVSDTNPGVANWLDTGGLPTGEMTFRYNGFPAGTDLTGTPVTTEVVPLADVRSDLPTDTPTVSPEQFAADMNERVLSYDYMLDASRQDSWVTQELYLHDLEAAMGSSNFDAVFGAEPSTPMWLRLTPALSPDWGTEAKDMLTNPSASWTAIQDNLPLAEKDISLPIQLAETLWQQDIAQTTQAVQSDLSSGDLAQALTALTTGGQQLGSILNDALFDPNTSITAGLLNARDDLATAVMAATSFPSQAGPLATLEWDYISELTQLTPSTMASDVSSLLDPTTVATDLSTLLHDFLGLF